MNEPEIEFTNEQLTAALRRLIASGAGAASPSAPSATVTDPLAGEVDASLPNPDEPQLTLTLLRGTGITGVTLRALDPDHTPQFIRIALIPGHNFVPAAFDPSTSKVLNHRIDTGALVVTAPGGKLPPLTLEVIRNRLMWIFARHQGGGVEAAAQFLATSRWVTDKATKTQLTELAACAVCSREDLLAGLSAEAKIAELDSLGELKGSPALARAKAQARIRAGG